MARQTGLYGPKVCYNGGLIYDEYGTILRDVGINLRLAMDFRRFVSERYPDLVVSAYLYNIWLTEDPRNPLIRQEAQISGCASLMGTLEQVEGAVPRVHKLLWM